MKPTAKRADKWLPPRQLLNAIAEAKFATINIPMDHTYHAQCARRLAENYLKLVHEIYPDLNITLIPARRI